MLSRKEIVDSWWAYLLGLWSPHLMGRSVTRRRNGHQGSLHCGAKGRGPGCPGSGLGLCISNIDSINLTYSVPIALGFANFLFLEMFLSGDGKGRTVTASGIGDLGPFL